MPANGYLRREHLGSMSRFLKKESLDKIRRDFMANPEAMLKKVATAISFDPQQPSHMDGQNVSGKYENMPEGTLSRNTGYRYPSPGSMEQAVVPEDVDDDIKYDTKYFTRDTKRNVPIRPLVIGSPGRELPEEVLTTEHTGSPGYNRPAVFTYDKTGLRCAVTSTWAARDAELQKHMPNHLPEPTWVKNGDAIAKKQKELGLPPTPGAWHKWQCPPEMFIKKW